MKIIQPFEDNAGYKRIVEVLSSNRYGLTREAISEKTGVTMGGTLSGMLKALVQNMYSGRVQRVATLEELFG